MEINVQAAGIWSRYQPRSLIGQGVYGKVHKAICMETNRTVAIKETLSDLDGILPTTMRELAILAQVQHPNVVKMIEADQCMINNQVFIVMEFCNLDLSQFIRSRMDVLIDPLVVQDFLYQILSGVEAIHKCGLVHRDIKPGYCLKIADFGLGRRLEPVVQCYTPDTMLYRAPEVFLHVPKVLNVIDIWSVACIFAEMLRGEPLFHGNRELELLESLGRPTREECEMFNSPLLCAEESGWEKPDLCDLIPRLDETGQDLMEQMFAMNPAKRITATYAKKHVYFQDYKPKHDFE